MNYNNNCAVVGIIGAFTLMLGVIVEDITLSLYGIGVMLLLNAIVLNQRLKRK